MSEGAVAGEAAAAPAAVPDTGAAPSVASTLGVVEGTTPEAGASAGDSPAPNVPEWAREFSPEDQAVVIQKGWKGFGDAVKAYKGVESRLGANPDQLLKLPNRDNPQEVADFNARLGVPVDVAGYEIAEGERIAGAVEAGSLAELAHSLELPADKFGAFVEGADQIVAAMNESATQERVARDAKEEADLRKEWGAVFEENVQTAAKAMPLLGLEPDQINAVQAQLGYAETMKVLARVGRALAEGTRGDTGEHGNGPTPFGLTPEVAKAQLEGLNADKEHFDAISNPSHPKHASETAKRNALKSAAYGG